RHLGSAVGVRLAIPVDDLDWVLLTRDGDTTGQYLAHLAEHPLVSLAEGGNWPRCRTHHADFDGAAGGARQTGEQCWRRDSAGGADAQRLDDLAARQIVRMCSHFRSSPQRIWRGI